MKVTVDIPSDIAELLMEKCKETGLSPSQFISALLEWYFPKRKKTKPLEISEFLAYARKIGEERMKYCKYSDGKYCLLESLDNIFEDSTPEPIDIYRCLFCVNFVDKRKLKKREQIRLDDDIVKVAKIAAKLVVELYGDKLGYRPKLTVEKEREISKDDVKKLIENW